MKSKKTKYIWNENFKPTLVKYILVKKNKEAEKIYKELNKFWENKYGKKI